MGHGCVSLVLLLLAGRGLAWHMPPPPPLSADASAGIIRLTPADDCGAVVASSPEGSTFLFSPGVYRELALVARDGDTFVGDSADPEAVVFSGARTIAPGQVESRGGLFVATNRNETAAALASHPCEPGFPRCNFLNDLYVDGVPQLHVGSAAKVNGSGTFFFDYEEREIIFGADPRKHAVELAVTESAVMARNAGKNSTTAAARVTVANVTVTMYAAPAQFGAIGHQYPGDSWTVSNVHATLNHGAGAKVHTEGRILSSRFVRNGQMGAGSSGYAGGRGSNVVLAGCEIAHNNYAGYQRGWEAGAGKFSSLNGAVLEDNFVHDNFGHGLWADVDGCNYTYRNNLVVNNTGPGIAHEISWAAVVENNTLCFNGQDQFTWIWGGQVQVQNSRDVIVRGNTAVVSAAFGNGIGMIFQDRGNGTQGVHATTNTTVEDNTVVVLGPLGGQGFTGADADRTVVQGVPTGQMFSTASVDRNAYYFETPDVHHKNETERGLFHWRGNNRCTWPEWQAFGNDKHGSVHALAPGVVPAACYA